MGSERLEIRLTHEDRDLLEHAAALRGQSVSDFVVSALVERAREIVARPKVTKLTARDRDRFLEILEDDEPSQELVVASRRCGRTTTDDPGEGSG